MLVPAMNPVAIVLLLGAGSDVSRDWERYLPWPMTPRGANIRLGHQACHNACSSDFRYREGQRASLHVHWRWPLLQRAPGGWQV